MATSLIEVHDVRFVAGTTIDDTIPELRRQWFGRRDGLHLDAYMAVRAVDGWAVRLGREPAAPRPERLWFVNLGAYRPDSLAELHHFGLVVASTPRPPRPAQRPPPSASGCGRAAAAQGRSLCRGRLPGN